VAKQWSWQLGENRAVPPPAMPSPDEALESGTEPVSPPPPAKIPDEWWERLVKGVPVEAVGGYTALIAFLKVPGTVPPLLFGFIVGLVITYLAMTVFRGVQWNNPDRSLRRVARIQILLALAAFTVGYLMGLANGRQTRRRH